MSFTRTLNKTALEYHQVTRLTHKFNSKNARHFSNTVDQKEVDKHSALRDSWWDPKSGLNTLHQLNELRVPLIRDGLFLNNPPKVAKPLEGKKILDVACGGGFLSEALARLGAEVTGVDASPELIEIAKEHCSKDPELQNNMPNYVCSLIEDHAKENREKYDGVAASEIIEHIVNKELFLKSCLDTLKPGGSLFITTPNRTNLAWFFGIVVAEYVLRIIPKGTHDFDKFITAPELTRLLEKENCKTIAVYGTLYDGKKWRFSNHQYLHYCLHAIKY